ncbi:MAG TPA: hypothetical protein VF713_26150 [Thermoanaerobaculia bacterium]
MAQQPQSSSNHLPFGLVVGFLAGYPLSYFFQSRALQAKLSLGQYIQNFDKILGDSSLVGTVILGFIVSIGVCGLVGFLIKTNSGK